MQRNPIPTAVLAAALSACSLQPEVLNSERIKDRFGNYGIEIIQQDGGIRVSNLYSTHDGNRICRTYAVVKFIGSNLVDLTEVHNRIVDGASIGSTLKDAGWEIRKESVYVGTLSVAESRHPINALMHLQSDADLAVHAYKLHIEKVSFSIHYATIIEMHHPDYLDYAELRDLYPVSSAAGDYTVNRVHQLVLGQSRD